MKPTLLYDRDCGFCRYWVARWSEATGEAVDYVPSAEAGEDFPDVAPEQFREAVQFVDSERSVYSGAEAVFRCLSNAPGGGKLLWWYRKSRAFQRLSEAAYRAIASYRNAASLVNRMLWGVTYARPTFALGQWSFFRNLGLIFVIAFASLFVQIEGLIGENGITPAEMFLDAARDQLGDEAYGRLPTVFWFGASEAWLRGACFAGVFCGALVTAGFLTPLSLFVCWVLYLSLLNVGQDFLSFQWDILLLETAILALFIAPWQILARPKDERPPSRVFLFLMWWLLFRLMVSSGAVKLPDEVWRDLTALTYHYETQPLPTAWGWYAHQFPLWFQKTSTLIMFAIEIGCPFLIFLPRRTRHLGGIAMIGFMLLIAITGNYCFFNWLTVALCLLLFDDQFLVGLLPKRARFRVHDPSRAKRRTLWRKTVRLAIVGVLVIVSGSVAWSRIDRDYEIPALVMKIYQPTSSYFIFNSYGLFANMTTSRPEIVIEGSNEGTTWIEYPFRWKPGDLSRRPRWNAPHQPRLDWQMWFAALRPPQYRPGWFDNFVVRLLQGEPMILRLLAENPFPDAPPKFIRARLYDYHFTTRAERAETGNWWKRELMGEYLRAVELPDHLR